MDEGGESSFLRSFTWQPLLTDFELTNGLREPTMSSDGDGRDVFSRSESLSLCYRRGHLEEDDWEREGAVVSPRSGG